MGKVYLIGAGPGAADLITLRGARWLAQADAVLYDALVQPELLAMARADARLIDVGKRCRQVSTDQRFINRILVETAQRHAVVVRLKGGDPMIFGRAQEELSALQAAGIDYEIVPGITSALAAAAELGVSLTQRGVSRNVVFVTPRVGDDNRALSSSGDRQFLADLEKIQKIYRYLVATNTHFMTNKKMPRYTSFEQRI